MNAPLSQKEWSIQNPGLPLNKYYEYLRTFATDASQLSENKSFQEKGVKEKKQIQAVKKPKNYNNVNWKEPLKTFLRLIISLPLLWLLVMFISGLVEIRVKKLSTEIYQLRDAISTVHYLSAEKKIEELEVLKNLETNYERCNIFLGITETIKSPRPILILPSLVSLLVLLIFYRIENKQRS